MGGRSRTHHRVREAHFRDSFALPYPTHTEDPIVARTYVPSLVKNVRELAIYIARYGSTIRPAIAVLEPTAVASYDALAAAVIALNNFFDELYPVDE